MYNCSASSYVNNSESNAQIYGGELGLKYGDYMHIYNCTANMGVANKSKVSTFYDFFY